MANTIRFIKSFSTSRVAEEIYNKQKASGRPSISASAYGMNSLLVADCLQHEAMACLENADGGEEAKRDRDAAEVAHIQAAGSSASNLKSRNLERSSKAAKAA
ncbi:hypothetical protein RU07_11985 [Agrobacterium tumefaciens]|uniref:Uncharacterized protein n=1 Tax=Agrobacterium tumefaciens TaxID=358 RepID=A0A0D0KR02_AGRTU|nr:hypothetical protein RU07_11985 [Agrobacterium tumefaciens]